MRLTHISFRVSCVGHLGPVRPVQFAIFCHAPDFRYRLRGAARGRAAAAHAERAAARHVRAAGLPFMET